jgi:type I restriction-modification system DNA methylase subunit
MAKSVHPPAPLTSLAKLIESVSYRRHNHEVFSDFVEMSAIAISNAVDLGQREKREADYMRIVKKYEPQEIEKFPEMLASLVTALDVHEDGLSDVLGKTYHDLELHNKWVGQYFTPLEICRMIAKMTIGDNGPTLPECGYLTVMEPAAGSGAMVLAFAAEMKAAGLNYQTQLHVTAVDVDLKCCAMTYIQLSLLHIPAVIVHGNSLSLEEWSRWYTPAHILNRWDYKLRRKRETDPLATLLPNDEGIAPKSFSLQEEPTITLPVADKRGQFSLF